MTNSLFASFLNNITLLLALGFLYSFGAARWGDWRTLRGRMVGGVLFGAVAMAGMIFPLHYSPGLTFDGRTILLGTVGLFGGWQAASITVLMTALLRIWQGGVGQWVGLATILTSAGLGVLLYQLRARYAWTLDLKLLYGFGWAVHVVMLSCMLPLPAEVRWTLLADISAPVLIIYPLATTLFGRLLMGLEEQNRAAERIQESEAKYRQLFEMESDALFLIDNLTGEIYDANLAAVSLYGYSRDELLRMKNTDLSAEPDETRNASVRAISANTVQIPLRYHRKKDGTVFPVEIMATSLVWKGISVHIPAIRDITDKFEKRERIEYLSFHDQLTGLYNRRFYEEELKRLSTDRNLPLTLVIADVNGLKLTNDAFGHAAGDNLLRKLASILKEVCRQDDIVARIGGDEFILLLPRTDAAEAERIIHRISQAILRQKKELVILSASFGWATQTAVGREMQDVFKEAEDNMYRNKLSESDSVRNNTIHLIVRTLNEKNAGKKSIPVGSAKYAGRSAGPWR